MSDGEKAALFVLVVTGAGFLASVVVGYVMEMIFNITF